MKPKEFDELIKQKFDQNDFAYNPRHWDQLAEQMDGRAKKRSAIMWWLIPLAGIAASVAMAMGVTNLLRQPATNSGVNTASVQSGNFAQPQTLQNEPATAMVATNQQYPELTTTNNNLNRHHNNNKKTAAPEEFAISFENAVGATPTQGNKKGFVIKDILIPKKDKKEVTVAANDGYQTFRPEEEIVKPTKTSIILSGGINRGSQNNGYAIGATIRRMISDKVFIESDVAFASSNNTQSTAVYVPNASYASARMLAARNTGAESNKTTTQQGPQGSIVNENQNYNLSYAQISPSIGYKIIKQVSIGVGPDFQQMLADNRPAPSTVDRNNIAVAPTFDIGLIGKTEYSITKKVKAGVLYRKGINNVLTPMDKYIDRDYLQFQLKCAIFNR